MTASQNKLAVYIHWPFCKSKCPYCDFNSHVEGKIDHDKWLNAYLTEIEFFKNKIGKRNVTSIFFGGGTPSLMQPNVVEKILNKISLEFNVGEKTEITLEANPTSIEMGKMRDFKKAGVNRVSIGVQALNEKDLKFLGRQHSPNEAKEALKTAAGIFNNFSFDLIYARPEQDVATWKKELSEALKIANNHLSLYQLTIEKGTEFYSQFNKKQFVMPSEELAAEFYEQTLETMEKQGLPAYEVSNHAKPGFECQHNISYWEYDEYLGIGPGAHGRVNFDGKRHATMMIHSPDAWLKSVKEKGHGLQNNEAVDDETIIEEILMMGMRLSTGLSFEKFKAASGKTFNEVFDVNKVRKLEDLGLTKLLEDKIIATKQGQMVLNSLTSKLLSYR